MLSLLFYPPIFHGYFEARFDKLITILYLRDTIVGEPSPRLGWWLTSEKLGRSSLKVGGLLFFY
jgi:hypothetical protein